MARRKVVNADFVEAMFHAFHHESGLEHFIHGHFGKAIYIDAQEIARPQGIIKAPYRCKTRERFNARIAEEREKRKRYLAIGELLHEVADYLVANHETDAEAYEEAKKRWDKEGD